MRRREFLRVAAGAAACAIAAVETTANMPAISVASNLFIWVLLGGVVSDAISQPDSRTRKRHLGNAKALKLYDIA